METSRVLGVGHHKQKRVVEELKVPTLRQKRHQTKIPYHAVTSEDIAWRMETNKLGTQIMVFLKSLGQKYFSIPSDGDETGAVAVVPIPGSDDVLSSKQYTQKIKKVLQSYYHKHHEGQRQRSFPRLTRKQY